MTREEQARNLPAATGLTVPIDPFGAGRCAAGVTSSDGDRALGFAISVEKIWRGLRPGEEPVERRLFAGLRHAPLGEAEGMRAGTWRRKYAEQGVTLHQADCLIASAALGIGARLATANVEDFPMAELEVELWPSGP